ncbi:MAG: cytochrome P450 [Alcanivoracaceae bacterium]|nr:cytochrome P450 [Alcanivoracaceae bacterium]
MKKNYLAEYDAATEDEKYPLIVKWMSEEPLPFFKQLRQERPVLVNSVCTLVAKFNDVRDMLLMPKVVTVDLYKPKMGVTATDEGYLMAHDDDALHYREKSLMQAMLNRDDLPYIRSIIEKSCQKILKKAHGKLEMVRGYSRHVPAIMVKQYFGLDGIETHHLLRWSYWNQIDAFNNQPIDILTKEQSQLITDTHDEVSEEFGVYMGVLIARKMTRIKVDKFLDKLSLPWRLIKRIFYYLLKKEPPKANPDEVIMRMLKSSFDKDVDFNIVRLGVNAGGLLIGSIETTSQAVTQIVDFLLNKPELLAKARAAATDDDCTEFDNIVWEASRFVPIRPDIFRILASDYTVAKGSEHETHIPSGTIVRLLTQSAMFDSYAYKDPDDFNPDRNLYHNFTFGIGSHTCLGKYVGIVMIPEMVKQIILMQGLKSDGGINYKDSPFPEEFNLQWDK